MIIRKKKNDNYTTISNFCLQDKKLSLKAKGLWAFIMAKPNDWNFNGRSLASELKEGRESINKILKELETAGYLVRGQIRESKGKFTQAENILYEEPWTENPSTENPSTKLNTNTTKYIVAEATSPPKEEVLVSKLFYDVIKKYGLPVINHNHVKKWAKDFELFEDAESYLQTLVDKDLRTYESSSSYRPTLNRPLDIVEKKIKIQRFYNGGEEKPAQDPRTFGDLDG